MEQLARPEQFSIAPSLNHLAESICFKFYLNFREQIFSITFRVGFFPDPPKKMEHPPNSFKKSHNLSMKI